MLFLNTLFLCPCREIKDTTRLEGPDAGRRNGLFFFPDVIWCVPRSSFFGGAWMLMAVT